MANQQLDDERIFHTARRLPDAESREDYLDQICAGDQALRKRVEALLAVHEQEQGFLQSAKSDFPPTVDVVHNQLVGSSIGPYKLREVIGEGGMGTVYVAEQEKPLRRKVALKVIKQGMDSKAVVARFEAERNALALMNHPNIAKVLDAGTTDQGRPFFAMELVSGIQITEYCDENKLSIDQRLELFIQVCLAIQHAHQKGIIHRDIKPSNVLVTELDGKPIPKVIDFGVAKALNQSLTDQSIYTNFQAIIGTPLYMSPEQASLSAVDVDTRSDVYALGVLLYELLTGTTPFEQSKLKEAAQHEVLRIIREVEPPKPSNRISTLGQTATRISHLRRTQPDRLGRLVKGDLDWIVMTALAKERGRRYKTVDAFAEDLQKHLGNEPVSARPPSAIYRIGRFARRNRTAFAASVFVSIAFLAAFGGISWFAVEATTQKQKAEDNLAELQDSAFQHLFYGALLAGGIEEATIREDAAPLRPEQMSALRGLEAFYGSKFPEAIKYLEDATESPATLAVKSWCYIAIADATRAAETIKRARKLAARTPEDHLMLAQLYAWLRPEEALNHIEAAEKLSDIGVIGQVVRALASANKGVYAQNAKLVHDAADIFEAVRVLVPENKFVLEHLIYVYGAVGLVSLREGNEKAADSFFEKAKFAAEEFFIANESVHSVHFALLLAHQERYSESLAVLESLIPTANSHLIFYAPVASLAEEQEHAIDFLQQLKSDNYYAKMGLTFLYADDPDRRDEAKGLAHSIFEENPNSESRAMALEALLMAGEDEQAVAQLARQSLDTTEDLLWPIEFMQKLAQETPAGEQEIENIDIPSQQAPIRFESGLRLYSRGRFEEAARQFSSASECSQIHHGLWSKYFAKRAAHRLTASSESDSVDERP